MKTITLRSKRSWDVVDVTCDWRDYVTEDRVLTLIEWLAETPLAIIATAVETNVARLRVGGGYEGTEPRLMCRATFSDGQKLEQLIILPIDL